MGNAIMIDPSELESVYTKYGFEVTSIKQRGVKAFVLRSGYFHNADIVPFIEEADVESAKKDLESFGIACTIRHFSSIDDAQQQLFAGFFAAGVSRKRLLQDYQRFAKGISDTINAEYSYVSARYTTASQSEGLNPQIVEYILDLLRSEGPVLVIVEAAAGFGKSCTAFEVLKHLLSDSSDQVPILTELSLNRQAKIFRYVLLDEIDRNFPGLHSDLVQEQIQAGRTPLILDGFDELLSRSSAGQESYNDAEPMLQTIGEILTGQAKVLLTTRRTAFFSDPEFDKWMSTKPTDFAVHRIRLERPTLEDWLGATRVQKLAGISAPISDIANPVLLAFLRNVSDQAFDVLCNNPDKIVAIYLEAMLDREKERQNLKMSVDDQLKIFRDLARDMVRETFTTDSREYIQLRILESHTGLLDQVRKLYNREERPTTEEIATKLASHALLDRRDGNDQQVGFVNEFVLGTLVGDVVIFEDDSASCSIMMTRKPELFVDLAATAYAVQSGEKRDSLWHRLSEVINHFDVTQQLAIDLNLQRQLNRTVVNAAIESLIISKCSVGNHLIKNAVFSDCVFRNVEFLGAGLTQVTFLNCAFYNCHVTGRAEGDVWVFGCRGDKSLMEIEGLVQENPDKAETIELSDSFLRSVLENFWPKGKVYAVRDKSLRTLYRGHAAQDFDAVASAITQLRRRGLIRVDRDMAHLDLDRLNEIANILQRDVQ